MAKKHNSLSEFVRRKRGDRSLRDFAAASGLSYSFIGDLECGAFTPLRMNVETLLKLSVATKTPLADLLLLVFGDSNINEDLKKLSAKKTEPCFTFGPDEGFYKKHKLPVPDIGDVIAQCHFLFNGSVVSDNVKKKFFSLLSTLLS